MVLRPCFPLIFQKIRENFQTPKVCSYVVKEKDRQRLFRFPPVLYLIEIKLDRITTSRVFPGSENPKTKRLNYGGAGFKRRRNFFFKSFLFSFLTFYGNRCFVAKGETGLISSSPHVFLTDGNFLRWHELISGEEFFFASIDFTQYFFIFLTPKAKDKTALFSDKHFFTGS